MSAIDRELLILRGLCSCAGDEEKVNAAENEVKVLRRVAQSADELMSILGAYGEIDTLHPKTQILLDALYSWRPLFAEVSNVKLSTGERREENHD